MSQPFIPDEYCGHILKGNYSRPLKDHISRCIQYFQKFDQLGAPAIPYIAAWKETQHVIWYEFVGTQLIQLLDCDVADASEAFRNSMVQRHVYSKRDAPQEPQEIILNSNEVFERQNELRDAAVNSGDLDAVYKIMAADGKTYWLKDQARVKSFESDQIYISLGNLTIVTKEMEAEEHLKQTQIALRKSEQEFKEQAIHDNLTGLFNTRYLYTALPALIQKSAASHDAFSLVFMDIDDFKQVVDTHGHLNASKTLQEIAATLMAALPAPAFGVAYGGDEFVLVLPGFDKHKALEMADTIRQRIKKTVYLRKTGLKVRVHASLGVSTYPDDAETLTELLALADQAMFSVKERGKDSVCSISYQTTKDGSRIGKIFSYDCLK